MELDLLSMAAGAVLSRAGGDATGALTAPIRAVGEHWKTIILDRLQRHSQQVEDLSEGEVVAPERIRVKAAVEAALTDDVLAHRYLAGVVAGSSDDSGTATLSMIGRLSARELRLHYVLYRELHRLLHAPDAPFLANINEERDVGRNLEMFLELDGLLDSLDVERGPTGVRALLGSLRALAGERLIAPYGGHAMSFLGPSDGFTVGSPHHLSEFLGSGRITPTEGAIIRPSVTGMSLMAWVFSSDGTGDPASFRGLEVIPGTISDPPPEVPSSLVTNLPRK